MKFMNIARKLPADIYFPELDAKTIGELDALHADFVKDSHVLQHCDPEPMPFNPIALREMEPKMRSIFRYIWERKQREYEEFLRKKTAA